MDEMVLRGLKTLNDLRLDRLTEESLLKTNGTNEVTTIIKSKIFHPSFK
jgi:hypothetical protein